MSDASVKKKGKGGIEGERKKNLFLAALPVGGIKQGIRSDGFMTGNSV